MTPLAIDGGAYQPGTLADLREDSFVPDGTIERAGRTLMPSGSTGASEEYEINDGPQLASNIGGFALAALNESFKPEESFGHKKFKRAG